MKTPPSLEREPKFFATLSQARNLMLPALFMSSEHQAEHGESLLFQDRNAKTDGAVMRKNKRVATQFERNRALSVPKSTGEETSTNPYA